MEEEEEEEEKEEKAIVRSAPDGSDNYDNNWYIFAHKGDIGQSTM